MLRLFSDENKHCDSGDSDDNADSGPACVTCTCRDSVVL